MKIKILNNVVHAGKVLKAGLIADLQEAEAQALVKLKHAIAHLEAKAGEKPPGGGDAKK